MFHQNINLPLITESVLLENLSLEKIFNSYNLSFKNILVLTGGQNSSRFADQITSHNSNLICCTHKNTDNSLKLISNLKNSVFDSKAELIIGIGGGKVLDTAKFLATKTSLPYIAVPTVVSSDALASPISILKNENSTKGYSAQIPSGILIDYDVIASSGKEHIYSGLGDIISNLSALNDWDLAVKAGKAQPNNFARFLSEVSVSNILNHAIDLNDRIFVKTYVNSIIMSGLSMNISGNSRPCSGSEHLITHALSELQLSSYSHGLLVGSLTPFTLYLQSDKRYLDLIKYISIFIDIKVLTKVDQLAVFKLAKQMRGNRFTILNKFTDKELRDKYFDFLEIFTKGEK